jgi:hypothetical protein
VQVNYAAGKHEKAAGNRWLAECGGYSGISSSAAD